VEPIGENLSYGTDTARERVLTLLIDDGFANRAHRKRLLDPSFHVTGIACGDHKLSALCVITLTCGFNANAYWKPRRCSIMATSSPKQIIGSGLPLS
jgi:hypothetical protein